MTERKETLLLTLTYSFYGHSYNRSILFLNRGKEQIRFQLACRQSDFQGVTESVSRQPIFMDGVEVFWAAFRAITCVFPSDFITSVPLQRAFRCFSFGLLDLRVN